MILSGLGINMKLPILVMLSLKRVFDKNLDVLILGKERGR